MNDLPELPTKPNLPEYRTWPLEKLQDEYWILNMKYLSKLAQQSDTDQRIDGVDNFIAALKRLMEEE